MDSSDTALEQKYKNRIHKILDVVLAYASGEYEHRAEIKGDSDLFDALAAGINMLGDELRESTVSLREKDVLLKEIHHRVKNNLQIVSSILDLQAGFSESDELKEKFNECQIRIKSMALVHEKLYQTRDLSKIGINDYFETLTGYLDSIYKNKDIELRLELLDSEHFFSIDSLLPLGLILTEILTNSYKHAFTKPMEEKGMICVELKGKQDEIVLTVSDNGKGVASDVDLLKSESLGMNLIRALIDQIGARLNVSSEKGVRFEISVNPLLKSPGQKD